MKCIGNKVLVKPVKRAEQIAGIFIPESARDLPQQAVVIGVGLGNITPKGIHYPFEVKPGDLVWIKYHGQRIEIGGEDHLVMPEDHILGWVEE